MWRCNSCGNENQDDRTSCWKCWIPKDETIPPKTVRVSLAESLSASSGSEGKQQTKSNQKPADTSTALIAVGIVAAIIGVALYLISPSFIFYDKVPGQFMGTPIMLDRTKDFTGVTKFGGIFLLVGGGIIAAIGFSQFHSNQRNTPRPEPAEALKTCPQCAESVKHAAKICRFCGHHFS